jgi:hypothetical protein
VLIALTARPYLAYAQREVRAREAAHELRRVGVEPEAVEDLVAHDRRRGRRAREHARAGKLAHEVADLHVFGPEVVAPFADAVSLVHRDQRTVDLAEKHAKAFERQPLGRDVDELEIAGGEPARARAQLLGVERRGQIRRRYAACLQRLDLVVHERDQRRDDDRRARQQRGR